MASNASNNTSQINSQINIKQRQIKNCKNIVEDLKDEKIKLKSYMNNWENKYRIHKSTQICESVVITNVFEGACAEKLYLNYSSTIQAMQKNYQNSNDLICDIDSQVNKLNQHINKLERDISVLRTRL